MRLLGLLATASMLFGCKVGPDYCRPGPPPVTRDFTEATEREAAAEDDLTYWWSYLQDPTLNELIGEACRQNLDLREACYRIAVARARLGVVRADRLPQASGTGEYSYRDFAENATQFVSSTAGNKGFSYHSLGFDTSWEIDLFGKIARSIEAAEADIGVELQSYYDVKVSLLAEVASTYIELRLAQERLQIAVNNLEAQQRTLKIVRSRLESGLVSPLDVAQAESNVYTTAATIPQLRQQETTAINQLAFLIGRTPSGAFKQRLARAPIPTAPPGVSVGVPADLLCRRPDVRAAERRVASASANVGVAVAEKYPQISILGNISADAKDVDMLFTSGSLAYNVGPSVRWNILNFGQLNNMIAGRNAELCVAVVNYQRTVLSAVQEVEDGLVAYHQQSERAGQLQRAVDATQRAVDSSQARYEQGLVGFQPVLDSQRQLLSAEDSLAASRAEALIGLVRVYKALGGGWDSKCQFEVASATPPTGALESEPEATPEPAVVPEPGPELPPGPTEETPADGPPVLLPPQAAGRLPQQSVPVQEPAAEQPPKIPEPTTASATEGPPLILPPGAMRRAANPSLYR